jgi:hypothetical protein
MTLSGQPKTIESSGNRREPRLPRKLGYSVAVVAAIILLVSAARFIYHTKTETFSLAYFPGNTYAPARELPGVDEHGEPRVVLVRRTGQIECFDVFYSQKLRDLLQASPSRRVNITYRVFYRFGHSFWIETLDVAGLGIEPSTSRFSVRGNYRTGNTTPGECF